MGLKFKDVVIPYGLNNGNKLRLRTPFSEGGLTRKGENVTYLEEYMAGIFPTRLITVFDEHGVIHEGVAACRFEC